MDELCPYRIASLPTSSYCGHPRSLCVRLAAWLLTLALDAYQSAVTNRWPHTAPLPTGDPASAPGPPAPGVRPCPSPKLHRIAPSRCTVRASRPGTPRSARGDRGTQGAIRCSPRIIAQSRGATGHATLPSARHGRHPGRHHSREGLRATKRNLEARARQSWQSWRSSAQPRAVPVMSVAHPRGPCPFAPELFRPRSTRSTGSARTHEPTRPCSPADKHACVKRRSDAATQRRKLTERRHERRRQESVTKSARPLRDAWPPTAGPCRRRRCWNRLKTLSAVWASLGLSAHQTLKGTHSAAPRPAGWSASPGCLGTSARERANRRSQASWQSWRAFTGEQDYWRGRIFRR